MKTHSIIALALLFACTLSFASGIRSVDAELTVLYTNPPIKYVTPGSIFTVDIDVSYVELLYDWQVNMTFDPSVLRCMSVTEGDFFAEAPEGSFGPAPVIRQGWALFGWLMIGDHRGLNGSGTLAHVEFEALATGESSIEFANIGTETYLDAQTSSKPPPRWVPIEFAAHSGLVVSSLGGTLAVLYIDPPTKYVTPSVNFTVDIEVSDVEYLYSWQANMTFNPTVLRCVNVTEGDFLKRQPQGSFGPSPVIEEGSALFGWLTLGGYVGASGSGTLATVEFEVLATGESLIELVDIGDQTFLWAQTSPNPPPNFEDIEFTAQNGLIIVNSMTPVTTISLSGVQGRNGWFNSEVTATLLASGLGINKTEHSFDNVTWNTYSVPFIITDEGNVTVYYRSTNSYGSIEQTRIETIKIDKTPPTGSTTINDNTMYTQTNTVVLSSSASDITSGLAEMRCSNDNITYTQWLTYDLSTPWTLQEGDGTKTVYVQFRDYSGLVSEVFSDTVILDTTLPIGSVVINEGALITGTRSATLSLTASDTTSGLSQTRFSQDNVTWTSWETYDSSKTWTLTVGDGSKTVYAQFKDNAGLVSEIYSDTITLDTTPPNIQTTSPIIGSEIKSSAVTATWSASDANSLNSYQVRLDGGPWIDVGLDSSYTFTGLADGSHNIEVKATDTIGLTDQHSLDFTVNTSPLLGPGYIEEAVVAAIVVIVIVGIALYLNKRRK